jgi:quinol monooxygenase YgiN
MIHVIATVDLQPGKRDAFLAEFRKLIPAVRAEAGCVEYVPTIDAETDLPNQARMGPDRVVIIEKWKTLAHLKAHAVAPHMQAYRPKVKDFVKSMELRVLSPD